MLASQCLRWGTKRSGHFRVTFTSPRGGQRDCVGLPRGSGSYNSKRSRSECPSRWTQPPPRWAEGGGAGAGVTAGRRARRPAGSEPPGCCWNGPGNRSSGTTARCSPGAAQGEEDKTNSRLPVSLTFKQGAKSPLFTAPPHQLAAIPRYNARCLPHCERSPTLAEAPSVLAHGPRLLLPRACGQRRSARRLHHTGPPRVVSRVLGQSPGSSPSRAPPQRTRTADAADSLRAAAPTRRGHTGPEHRGRPRPLLTRMLQRLPVPGQTLPTGRGTPSAAHREGATDLHVAVVVPGVAAVARVDQDGVQPVHDGFAATLRHVRADVQELGVAHVLWESPEGSSRLCLAP